jgi:hypothetical protein
MVVRSYKLRTQTVTNGLPTRICTKGFADTLQKQQHWDNSTLAELEGHIIAIHPSPA